jgi:hypothetical protein
MLCSAYCQCFAATNIKNNSRILTRSLLLGNDPFFSLLFLDQKCIKKIIAFPGGISTGQEFIAAIGKGLNCPLKEVKKVRPSRNHRILIANQLALRLIGGTEDCFWVKRKILMTITTRKYSFVADIVFAGG